MKKSSPHPPSASATTSTTPPADSRTANGRRAAALPHPQPARRATEPVRAAGAGPRNPLPGNGHDDSSIDAEQVLSGLMGLKKGDFTVRLPLGWTGISGKVADTFNEVAEMLSHSTEELSRISRVVGKEGRIQERLSFGQATAGWAERLHSVNALIDWLAQPVSETARVIDAVAKGDLSRNMPLEIY